jgi:hypothetical protein
MSVLQRTGGRRIGSQLSERSIDNGVACDFHAGHRPPYVVVGRPLAGRRKLINPEVGKPGKLLQAAVCVRLNARAGEELLVPRDGFSSLGSAPDIVSCQRIEEAAFAVRVDIPPPLGPGSKDGPIDAQLLMFVKLQVYAPVVGWRVMAHIHDCRRERGIPQRFEEVFERTHILKVEAVRAFVQRRAIKRKRAQPPAEVVVWSTTAWVLSDILCRHGRPRPAQSSEQGGVGHGEAVTGHRG